MDLESPIIPFDKVEELLLKNAWAMKAAIELMLMGARNER